MIYQVHMGVRDYYKVFAPADIKITPEKSVSKYGALSRMNFYVGSFFSTILLIQNVALACFYAIAALVTCGRSEKIKSLLAQNTQDATIHFSAIFIGLAGAVFPGSINKVLQFPIICYTPTA